MGTFKGEWESCDTALHTPKTGWQNEVAGRDGVGLFEVRGKILNITYIDIKLGKKMAEANSSHKKLRVSEAKGRD